MVGRGSQGQVRYGRVGCGGGMAWSGMAGYGSFGGEWSVLAGSGAEGCGTAWQFWFGLVWRGGKARYGGVRLGVTWCGLAVAAVVAWLSLARSGVARYGMVGRGS